MPLFLAFFSDMCLFCIVQANLDDAVAARDSLYRLAEDQQEQIDRLRRRAKRKEEEITKVRRSWR